MERRAADAFRDIKRADGERAARLFGGEELEELDDGDGFVVVKKDKENENGGDPPAKRRKPNNEK